MEALLKLFHAGYHLHLQLVNASKWAGRLW
jgi:hypothetical protein